MPIRARLSILPLFLTGAVACEELTTPEKVTIQYTVEVNLFSRPDTIVTGDTLEYSVTVTRTQGPTDSLLSQRWTSSDTTRLAVVNRDRGVFLARGVIPRESPESVTVAVVLRTEAGEVTLEGRDTVSVPAERFYGGLSTTAPRFLDTLRLTAPPTQRFNAGTQVHFSAADTALAVVPGIVLSPHGPDTLYVVVPAGFTPSAAPIVLTEIGSDRRTLISRNTLDRPAGDTDLDRREPNDASPSALANPFTGHLEFLSIHQAGDMDQFSFRLAETDTLTFYLAWNVASNLDYQVFFVDPVLGDLLVFEGKETSTVEEPAQSRALRDGDYKLKVFAQSFVGPTTYLLSITR